MAVYNSSIVKLESKEESPCHNPHNTHLQFCIIHDRDNFNNVISYIAEVASKPVT